MEECCLVFKIMPNRDRRLFPNGLFQKGMGHGHRNISYVRPDGGSLITNEGERLRQEIERMMQEDRCLSVNFNQMTVELMKQKRMTVNALAEATGLSEKTIKNLRNRESIAFPIQEIVAVCIALHLPPQRSGPYINISPSKFLNTVDMKLYEYALTQWYRDPVPVVNRRLVEAGAKPLTNLVEGFDEEGNMCANE